MTAIETITLQIQTADKDGAGTDGDVYLGVCGREFRTDTSADDYERDSSREYVFGDGANINNASVNDPRVPQLHLENADRFPVYIRFQPTSRTDNWKLLRAEVSFNGAFFPRWDTGDLIPFDERGGIWLGTRSGLWVHIARHSD